MQTLSEFRSQSEPVSCPPHKVVRRDNAIVETDNSPKCEVSTTYM